MSPGSSVARGFILQPSYRIEHRRPIVHLYGVLEDGGSFLVRDRREVPTFYVRQADRERAAALGASPLAPVDKRTMRGDPVAEVQVEIPSDTPPLRDRLTGAGIECFEADVRFAMRYLIRRGIRSSLTIRGEPSEPVAGIDRVFDEPQLEPADWTPELSLLSLDIETDPTGRRLLSVALEGCGVSEVLLFTPRGWEAPPAAVSFHSERDLFLAFCERVRELDPDVLTGWNVIDFDLATLDRLADRFGAPFEIGRGPGSVRLREEERSRFGSRPVTVPGRVVLDGIDLLRGSFVRLPRYSLGAVAREVLGEDKTLTGPDRAAEILRLFRQDRPAFVEYNRRDAQLVTEILDRLDLVSLAVERSRLTGMPPDRVAASIAAFDFLYLSELARRGLVGPTVGSAPESSDLGLGGHILTPRPGLYRNVLVLDFKSLYPSLIRTFEIDPLGFLPSPAPEDDPIVAPNGAAFARRPGILSGMLDQLFPRREAAQAAGDEVASQAIKILMNSFYGVLGTPACRFYNPLVANAITSFGKEVLVWSKRWIEAGERRTGGRPAKEVLYGDTDSLFVASAEDDPDEALRLGERLVRELNRALAEHVERTWRVESRLVLELERLYRRFFLPAARYRKGGAAKRYVGSIERDGERRVVFTGMEVVRRDWTDLAKRVQRGLYERWFTDRPVEEFLRDEVAALRGGERDDELVYVKALRKAPDEYTATTPPHVAAARLMKRPKKRGLVSYVMTVDGPQPAAERTGELDYEHYVQKQLRPVAEPVLAEIGLDFDEVIGDEHQLTLF